MSGQLTYQPVARQSFLLQKIGSLQARAGLLKGLDKIVAGKDNGGIKEGQWQAINGQLASVANRILLHLQTYTDRLLPETLREEDRYKLVNALGEIEMELSNAYSFYDTYMDILTQRLSPVLGRLLGGCDAIAADGLKHTFLSTTTHNPIVYCDRGFGASILREGLRITGATNPVAFIAIPYSRLAEKYNLISIYHEVGHQALAKLQLVETFQQVFAESVKRAGGNGTLQGIFSNWSREVMPDFWAFGHTGMAQTSSMRDVLMMPQAMAMQVSPYQQHPPCYIRFLISVAWCRQLWGRGVWDEWAGEWETFYPLHRQDELTRQVLQKAKKLLPVIARAVINTKFKKLGNKTLASLFDLDAIAPHQLITARDSIRSEPVTFNKLPIGIQLAGYRLLRDEGDEDIETLNNAMRSWLINLN